MDPQVTIIIVPRERFSFTRQSLESIYEHTRVPFELVYVDGNSPPDIRRYLEDWAAKKAFRLLRTDTYLSPNKARNLGLQAVQTPYLVFADNDIIVSPGWLENLLQCAAATGAAVVGPLMCQDEPVHQTIHFAGGESHIWTDKLGRRRLREKMYRQGQPVATVAAHLQRQATELAEFHCVLVRRSIFDRLGPLDEAMMNTKEHLDFCMGVRQAGEEVYFEPSSVVTYVPGPPLRWTDVHFYMLRWSNAWTLSSLQRLQAKWQLAEDGYFTTKYKRLGWRRRVTLIDPLAQRFAFGSRWLGRATAKAISLGEGILNRVLTDRHRTQRRSVS